MIETLILLAAKAMVGIVVALWCRLTWLVVWDTLGPIKRKRKR